MKEKREEEVIRTRLPEGEEMFGIVEQMLGYGKLYVRCQDGQVRLGRIPRSLWKRVWIKEGDIVIVKPWEVMKERVDVVYRYTPTEVEWLRRKGYLKWLEEEEL